MCSLLQERTSPPTSIASLPTEGYSHTGRAVAFPFEGAFPATEGTLHHFTQQTEARTLAADFLNWAELGAHHPPGQAPAGCQGGSGVPVPLIPDACLPGQAGDFH